MGFLYRNRAGGGFEDATYPSGIRIDNGWGVAWADIDGDGDLDLLANRLYRNDDPEPGNWLKIRLKGARQRGGHRCRGAPGSRRPQLRQVEGGKGTTTQNPLTLHVGLGDVERVDVVRVRWPSDPPEETVVRDVAVNRMIDIRQGAADAGTDTQEDIETPSRRIGQDGCACRAAGPPDFPTHAGIFLLSLLSLPGALRKRI